MNSSLRNRALASVAIGGIALTAAASAFAYQAGGSSFDNNAFSKWCVAASIQCSYNSVGSTTGITHQADQLYDWSATDAPLTATQAATLQSKIPGEKPVYIAALLGGVTFPTHVQVSYHGQQVYKTLNLTAPMLALMFDGQVKYWNQLNTKAFAAFNPGVVFPNSQINLCVRDSGSGTSYNASNYMARSSVVFGHLTGAPSQYPAWGGNKILAHGGSGVAACIASNQNSIGYVDYPDALNANLQNISKLGHPIRVSVAKTIHGKRYITYKIKYVFVAPSSAAFTLAGNSSNLNVNAPFPLEVGLLNSSNPKAYPATITSFVLAYSSYTNPQLSNGATKLAHIKNFLAYGLGAGQNTLVADHYAPLPPKLLAKEKALAAHLK